MEQQSSFAIRLKQVMHLRGKNQADIVADLGISKAAMSQYLSGKFMPKETRMNQLAVYFHVDTAWLRGYGASNAYEVENTSIKLLDKELDLIHQYRAMDAYGKDMVTTVAKKEYDRCMQRTEQRKMPRVYVNYNYDATVSAGTGDALLDYAQWQKIAVLETAESRKADFILRVDGDSMEPQFSDGDLVLVRQQPAVDKGQIGIFCVDGMGYMKEYQGSHLVSLNPNYRNIRLTEDARCFGLVLGIAEPLE